jgi:hypothetical protein
LNTADFFVPDTANTFHTASQTVSSVGAGIYTFSAYLKAGGYNYGGIRLVNDSFTNDRFSALINLTNGVVEDTNTVGSPTTTPTVSVQNAGNGWYKVTITLEHFSGNLGSTVFVNHDATPFWSNAVPLFAGDGSSGIYLWGAHLYRSDLGGMVDNPDRGDSYVPTTSSAVYLPRRGHHVYNGSAWVNEGLLHESEARTNLITYSEAFDNAAWSKADGAVVVSNQAVSPDGQANADQFYGPSGSHIIQNMSASADTAYTVSLFVKSNGTNVIDLAINFRASSSSLGYFSARFDLSTENVTNPSPSVGQTADSAIIESFGNGWYRKTCPCNS